MNLIFLGDVVGKGGRNAVTKVLPGLKREFNAQFAIVNGENSAAGAGLSASCVRELLTVAEVVTGGESALPLPLNRRWKASDRSTPIPHRVHG